MKPPGGGRAPCSPRSRTAPGTLLLHRSRDPAPRPRGSAGPPRARRCPARTQPHTSPRQNPPPSCPSPPQWAAQRERAPLTEGVPSCLRQAAEGTWMPPVFPLRETTNTNPKQTPCRFSLLQRKKLAGVPVSWGESLVLPTICLSAGVVRCWYSTSVLPKFKSLTFGVLHCQDPSALKSWCGPNAFW